MRILLHDYGGYAFTAELAQRMGRRGHEVHYLYAAENPTPSTGSADHSGPSNLLHVTPIEVGWSLRKYSFLRRWLWEVQYGRRLASAVGAIRPDVCVSANAPIDSQVQLLGECERLEIPYTHWAQDLVGRAMRVLLEDRWGFLGRVIGGWYERRELAALERSQRVIVISEDFAGYLKSEGIGRERVRVLPNWAPISRLPQLAKDNAWAREHAIGDKFVFLYTGTLALKHDPAPLIDLARAYSAESTEAVIVVSEGPGADWLQREAKARNLTSMRVLPYQPRERYAQVLAAGDVLVGLLQPAAGSFSVPSKVLSYLCAGRPILLQMPRDNPAAQLVEDAGAGIVVPPGDRQAFTHGAAKLRASNALRGRMGERGLKYAQAHFDEERITDRFLDMVMGIE